jgi:dissimilatory sulfite reductase (desulfoviridin) alpha/beta subunit
MMLLPLVDQSMAITLSISAMVQLCGLSTPEQQLTIYSPKNQQKGTAIVIGGKGRYAGAKGDGTWEGVTTQPAVTSDGAIQYVDSVINIKK